MAIVVPILSEFSDKGIRNANKSFKDLEGVGAKTAFALKKAFIPATAALGALAAVTVDAVNAALEDEKAQKALERTIKATTGATDDQVIALNEFIDNAGKTFGVVDDDLRPALQRLATATGDVKKSMDLANLAMDIATATGKPLEQVADALGKAYNGQYLALNKLDPSLRDVVKSGGDADEIFGRLNDKFGGAAQANAETAAGKFQIFQLRMDELKESIGASLLPAIEAVLPFLERMATWAEENPGVFKTAAAAIAAIAGSIVLINVAMATNPIVLLASAIAGLAVIIALNWPKVKQFFVDLRNEIDKTLGPLDEFVALLVEGGIGWFNIGKKIFGRPFPAGNPNVPAMADGGIVKARNGGTLALIGEGGRDEAVVPLGRGSSAFPMSGVTINVSGALDPVAVAQQIDDILRNQQARFGY